MKNKKQTLSDQRLLSIIRCKRKRKISVQLLCFFQTTISFIPKTNIFILNLGIFVFLKIFFLWIMRFGSELDSFSSVDTRTTNNDLIRKKRYKFGNYYDAIYRIWNCRIIYCIDVNWITKKKWKNNSKINFCFFFYIYFNF